MTRIVVVLGLVLLAVGCTRSRRGGGGAELPSLHQTLEGFHRPESCVFSPDGEYLFVSNCGSNMFGPDRKTTGFVKGHAVISRLAVGKDGKVSVENLKWVEGLSGSLGIGFLPKATGRYPKGTLLINVGMSLLTDDQGKFVTDASQLGCGVLFLDPSSGKKLGKIDLGVGSAVAKELGHPVLIANSIAFDGEGNLYVTDTAKGGNRLVPAIKSHPGLLRIPHGSIDDPSKGGVSFMAIPGVPNGVRYRASDDSVYVVTMGGRGPDGQAVFPIKAGSLDGRSLPTPMAAGVGTMDGLCFTPAGTIVASRFTGDLIAIASDGTPTLISLPPFVKPADIDITTLADGTSIVAVPEQNRMDPRAWSQNVRIILIPKGHRGVS